MIPWWVLCGKCIQLEWKAVEIISISLLHWKVCCKRIIHTHIHFSVLDLPMLEGCFLRIYVKTVMMIHRMYSRGWQGMKHQLSQGFPGAHHARFAAPDHWPHLSHAWGCYLVLLTTVFPEHSATLCLHVPQGILTGPCMQCIVVWSRECSDCQQ